jgi:hypothetical protein
MELNHPLSTFSKIIRVRLSQELNQLGPYRVCPVSLSLSTVVTTCTTSNQGILKGKYHCTIDLLFDWFGISCMTTDTFCFYLQNRLFQSSQTGGQWYSDTSPLSISCSNIPEVVQQLSSIKTAFSCVFLHDLGLIRQLNPHPPPPPHSLSLSLSHTHTHIRARTHTHIRKHTHTHTCLL